VTSAEDMYADALAGSITASLERDPVQGELARVVIRWFEGPGYLTIHALGTEDECDVPADDAWYPLEWPNEEHEIDRVDAVMRDEALTGVIEVLATEMRDEGWSWDEQPQPLIAAALKLRQAVEAAGLPTASHFAVGVSHFEGWGAEDSVPRVNPSATLTLLGERGLLPDE